MQLGCLTHMTWKKSNFPILFVCLFLLIVLQCLHPYPPGAC